MLLLQLVGYIFASLVPFKVISSFILGALSLKLQLLNLCEQTLVLTAHVLQTLLAALMNRSRSLTAMSLSLWLSTVLHSSTFFNNWTLDILHAGTRGKRGALESEKRKRRRGLYYIVPLLISAARDTLDIGRSLSAVQLCLIAPPLRLRITTPHIYARAYPWLRVV